MELASPARHLSSQHGWCLQLDALERPRVELLGQQLPARPGPASFDILAWNADGANVPARLHEQFLHILHANPLVTPGAVTILDSPLDLATIMVPNPVVGAVSDHLTPWVGTYRTVQLMDNSVG
jgi:poly(3-hydroxyalkanoate) synthetase